VDLTEFGQVCSLPCFSIAETDTQAEQDAEQTKTHSNYDTSHSMDVQLCRNVIEKRERGGRRRRKNQTKKEKGRGVKKENA